MKFFTIFFGMICMSTYAFSTGQKELEQIGHEDAPEEMRDRFEGIIRDYKREGWLQRETTISLKVMNSKTIEQFERLGIISNNCINNGRDTVWVAPKHGEYSDSESNFLLAHEVGHIIVNQKNNRRWNPHYWIGHVHTATAFGTIFLVTPMGITPFAVKAMKNWANKKSPYKPLAAWTVIAGAFAGINSTLNRNGIITPNGDKYKCGMKIEEFACDAIATTNRETSAQDGIAFFDNVIKRYGDKASKDHPKPSNRVNFLAGIAVSQEMFGHQTKKERDL
jgi:hypothetical protein